MKRRGKTATGHSFLSAIRSAVNGSITKPLRDVRRRKRFVVKRPLLFLSAGIVSLCGCFDRVSDKQWEKTVPGLYEGSQSNFREVLDLQPNGNFGHEAFIDQKLVHRETGHWSYDVTSGMVSVKPFTSFYDREKRRIMTNGTPVAADMFSVLRYGKSASRITQSIDTDYSLSKKGSETNSTENGKRGTTN
jgi:hypothetical protein